MNILYINHYAGGPAYGMEFRPFSLAKEWLAAGHHVTIVAASESHLRWRKPTITTTYTEEWIEGIRHVWCLTPPYSGNGTARVINIFCFLRRLWAAHRWLINSPDVVIASSTYPLDIYPAHRIARAHGARLIWEVHDLWPLSPIELGGIARWHPFMMLLQKAEDDACRMADAIVSILPHADEHLKTRGMPAEKFFHIPNGVDPTDWQPERILPLPNEVAERLSEERARGHFLIGYAGSHGVANALDTIIDAAAKSADPEMRLVLVGNGPEKARLKARAQTAHLRNVLFFDAVPKGAVPAFLNFMDVLYIGFRREPLYRFGVSPNKLIDYMMAGRPIICGLEASNDIVSEAGCGVAIVPADPDAINVAIARLRATEISERRRLGESGRRYAVAKHTFRVLAQRFLAVMAAH